MPVLSSSLSWRTLLAALAYGCSETLALLGCKLKTALERGKRRPRTAS